MSDTRVNYYEEEISEGGYDLEKGLRDALNGLTVNPPDMSEETYAIRRAVEDVIFEALTDNTFLTRVGKRRDEQKAIEEANSARWNARRKQAAIDKAQA